MKKPRFVAVYPGRFQPFHRGHFSVYQSLVQKFGQDNVFIVTSNKTEKIRSPFNFQEKKKIITELYDIPEDNIVQVKNPYNPTELLGLFTDHPTFITIIGEKDKNRLKDYVDVFSRTDKLENHKDFPLSQGDQKAFVLYATDRSGISSSDFRIKFAKMKDKDTFKDYFGTYDLDIFTLMSSKIKSSLFTEYNNAEMILEGGAFGHINHIYESPDVTFGDIKSFINSLSDGSIKSYTEKVDGQNLLFTYKRDEFVYSRNKSQIKSPLNIDELGSFLAPKDNIRKVFINSIETLEDKLQTIPSDKLNEIFEDGNKWYSIEIISKDLPNVFNYKDDQIVIHGSLLFDEDANFLKFDENDGTNLWNRLKNSSSKILPPIKAEFPRLSKTLSSTFKDRIQELQDEYSLRDSDKVSEFTRKALKNSIKMKAKEFNYNVDSELLDDIAARWAYEPITQLRDIKRKIKNSDFLSWFSENDKNGKLWKAVMWELEKIIFELEIASLRNIKPKIQISESSKSKIISKIKSSKDDTLKRKIEELGGEESIFPFEGIVLDFNGEMIKMTGIYQLINNIVNKERSKTEIE